MDRLRCVAASKCPGTGIHIFLSALAMALAACGGGGGGSSGGGGTVTPTTSVAGVVATGAPAAGISVTLEDTASHMKSATTGSDGSYQIDVTGLTPPFLLFASASSSSLYGYASASGVTANLNAYTTTLLQAYYASRNTTADAVFKQGPTLATLPSQQELNLLVLPLSQELQFYFLNAGITSTTLFNPFNTAFSANHTGFDQILDRTSILGSLSLSLDSGSNSTAGSDKTTLALSSGTGDLEDDIDFITNSTGPDVVQSSNVTVNICSSYAALVSGQQSQNCVASYQFEPAGITMVPGARLSIPFDGILPTAIGTVLNAYDSKGNPTEVPINELTSSVSNESVVEYDVQTYDLTAIALGTTVVTVTDSVSGKFASLDVTVSGPLIVPDVLSLTVPDPSQSNNPTSVGTLTVQGGGGSPIVLPSAAGWTSSDTNVVNFGGGRPNNAILAFGPYPNTVSVVAVQAGSATLTLGDGAGNVLAMVAVTVTANNNNSGGSGNCKDVNKTTTGTSYSGCSSFPSEGSVFVGSYSGTYLANGNSLSGVEPCTVVVSANGDAQASYSGSSTETDVFDSGSSVGIYSNGGGISYSGASNYDFLSLGQGVFDGKSAEEFEYNSPYGACGGPI